VAAKWPAYWFYRGNKGAIRPFHAGAYWISDDAYRQDICRKDISMKKYIIGAAIAALAVAPALSASVSPTKYSGHELARTAKITLDQARAAALKAHAGHIVDQELEKEAGGSGLRYSFDVVSHGKTIEVGIDAMTGAVLENAAESKAKEAKEARIDRHAKAAMQNEAKEEAKKPKN